MLTAWLAVGIKGASLQKCFQKARYSQWQLLTKIITPGQLFSTSHNRCSGKYPCPSRSLSGSALCIPTVIWMDHVSELPSPLVSSWVQPVGGTNGRSGECKESKIGLFVLLSSLLSGFLGCGRFPLPRQPLLRRPSPYNFWFQELHPLLAPLRPSDGKSSLLLQAPRVPLYFVLFPVGLLYARVVVLSLNVPQ